MSSPSSLGRRSGIAVALLLALALGACDSNASRRPQQAEPTQQTEQAKQGQGSFVSADGRFSVDLPGEPERITQQQPVGEIVLDVVLFNVEVGDELAYQIAYVDYPPSLGELDPDGVLRGAAGGAAAAVDGTLVATEQLDYRGHPAISFEINLDGAHIVARSLLADRRLYTLQAVSVHPPAPDFDRMIESFQLTG